MTIKIIVSCEDTTRERRKALLEEMQRTLNLSVHESILTLNLHHPVPINAGRSDVELIIHQLENAGGQVCLT